MAVRGLGRNGASHTLTFEKETGAFVQSLVLPGDPVPRAQYGYVAAVEDWPSELMSASSEELRSVCAPVFYILKRRAART